MQELKKKELEDLDAMLAELGLEAAAKGSNDGEEQQGAGAAASSKAAKRKQKKAAAVGGAAANGSGVADAKEASPASADSSSRENKEPSSDSVEGEAESSGTALDPEAVKKKLAAKSKKASSLKHISHCKPIRQPARWPRIFYGSDQVDDCCPVSLHPTPLHPPSCREA